MSFTGMTPEELAAAERFVQRAIDLMRTYYAEQHLTYTFICRAHPKEPHVYPLRRMEIAG